MKLTNPHIEKLVSHYKEISLLGKINAILGWDLNVNLPPKAATERASQTAYVTQKTVELWKNKEFISLLTKTQALDPTTLSLEEKAIVRNLTHASHYYLKIPQELIIEKEKVTSVAFMVWQQAKQKDSYKEFQPHLSNIIRINQEMANYLGYKENPYDCMLNLYEQGLTTSYTEGVFKKLQPKLTSLLEKIQDSSSYSEKNNLVHDSLKYPISDQKKIALFALEKMKFDFASGRMDVSTHPFTTELGLYDVRITNKYKEEDFRDSFTSTMHEGGHALYEQNINPAFHQTPLEGGVSFGIHEAMSRIYENQIGRNTHFLSYMTPFFHTFYKKQIDNMDTKTMIRMFNQVKPGYIRIEADEVTYTLHIILRFEIENALMNKKITAKEVPIIWKEKMQEYLGVTPPTDKEGVLQDVHWSYGAFGYFPSYALGNLYASQFFATMQKDIAVNKMLSAGNLYKITKWFTEHIYQYGSLYWPKELIKKVSGEELNEQYFIDYLTQKYTQIYHLT